MSRKGVSAEEKRRRLEQLFHESADFYQLKELEKIGPKKGIVSQSVKDVLTSLVDDGLVSTDKIATSNYFWSFPSTSVQTKRNKLDTLRKQVEEEEAKQNRQQQTLDAALSERENSEERNILLKELEEARNTQKALLDEIQKYKDNDPVMFKAKENASVVAKEAANRWTENIWAMQSYCTNKFGMDAKTFSHTFGIDDEIDTLP